jgi:hypothetical protein
MTCPVGWLRMTDNHAWTHADASPRHYKVEDMQIKITARMRPAPDDLHLYLDKPKKWLMRHYACHFDTVSRWLVEYKKQAAV